MLPRLACSNGKKALVTAWRYFKKKQDERNNCKICSQRKLGGAEVYELKGPGGSSVFDVEKAKQIVVDGRRPVLVPADALAQFLAASHCEEAHLPHVDPNSPGILGQRFSGFFIVDGVHRATRCLHEQRISMPASLRSRKPSPAWSCKTFGNQTWAWSPVSCGNCCKTTPTSPIWKLSSTPAPKPCRRLEIF